LSFTTVAIIFFNACSFFSTLIISPAPIGMDSLVNHIHDLCVDLLSHTLLLRLELPTLFTGMAKVDTVEIVRRSGFTKEATSSATCHDR
jgi:hypothetical protein